MLLDLKDAVLSLFDLYQQHLTSLIPSCLKSFPCLLVSLLVSSWALLPSLVFKYRSSSGSCPRTSFLFILQSLYDFICSHAFHYLLYAKTFQVYISSWYLSPKFLTIRFDSSLANPTLVYYQHLNSVDSRLNL